MPVLEAEAPVGRNAHDKFHRLVENAQKHPPVEVAVGPRIGLTKAIDHPWRYGLKGSPFLSKPFR